MLIPVAAAAAAATTRPAVTSCVSSWLLFKGHLAAASSKRNKRQEADWLPAGKSQFGRVTFQISVLSLRNIDIQVVIKHSKPTLRLHCLKSHHTIHLLFFPPSNGPKHMSSLQRATQATGRPSLLRFTTFSELPRSGSALWPAQRSEVRVHSTTASRVTRVPIWPPMCRVILRLMRGRR